MCLTEVALGILTAGTGYIIVNVQLSVLLLICLLQAEAVYRRSTSSKSFIEPTGHTKVEEGLPAVSVSDST